MFLIGIHGRKGSGKDTAFLSIRDWAEERGLRAFRQGFAHKLKLSAYRCFHPNPPEWETEVDEVTMALQWADYIKRDPDEKYDVTMVNAVGYKLEHESGIASYRVSGREFLQNYGTEAHRDVFGEDFWVDQLLPMDLWQENFNEADFAVIIDVRFENEAQRIRDLGGVVWYVDRPEIEDGDEHASEQILSSRLIDTTIPNDTDLDGFELRVRDLMEIDYHSKLPRGGGTA